MRNPPHRSPATVDLDPPPGFQGLDDELPIRRYHRYLPHWRQDGATYFVTFRFHDALPLAQQEQIREQKAFWERKNPPPHTDAQLEELHRILGLETEKWLDTGLGCCVLKHAANRELLHGVLHFFDLDRAEPLEDAELGPPRYELGAWVMMPNHVHLLIRPLEPQRWALEKILQSWKRQSAREINRRENSSGTLWLDESYDRIVRDAGHLWRCLQYIGRNPAQARVPNGQFERWVRPEWIELGWGFEDEEVG